MSKWDEEAFREINDIDAARLALRGALSTIRDLQSVGNKLKSELQDAVTSRLAAESRVSELAAALKRWEEEAAGWEKERRERAADEARFRNDVRQQVRAEESAKSEENRRDLEAALSRLRAELAQLVATQKEKEEGWEKVKKQLESREAELLAVQREKIELSERFRHDNELVERMREARDREITASLRDRDLELEARTAELERVKRQAEDLQKAAAASGEQFERRLHEKEEALIRDSRLKEQALAERYNKREADLQSSWSELENGLWQRTREAREKLDAAVNAQFEEKARALADRSKEIERLHEERRRELEAEYAAKTRDLEERYARSEQRLQDQRLENEKRFLEKFQLEISKEKESLREQIDKRARTLESEYNAKFAELDRRKDDLDAEERHRRERLAEDQARKDALRQREQDDFVARRGAELEAAHREALSRVSEELVRGKTELYAEKTRNADEFNKLKISLHDEQAGLLEKEKASLRAELEQNARALDDAYQAKAAELERARQSCELQWQEWKKGVWADFTHKEKTLELRWQTREQELMRGQETAIAELRRNFQAELDKTRDQFERERRRYEDEGRQRESRAQENFSALERRLRETWAAREAELLGRHEVELAAARKDYERRLDAEQERSRGDLARSKTEFQQQFNVERERYQGAINELSRRLAERDAELAEARALRERESDDLKARLMRAEVKISGAWKLQQEERARSADEKGVLDRQILDLARRAEEREASLAAWQKRIDEAKGELERARSAAALETSGVDVGAALAAAASPLEEPLAAIVKSVSARLGARLVVPGERACLETVAKSTEELRSLLARLKLLSQAERPELEALDAAPMLNELAAKARELRPDLPPKIKVENGINVPAFEGARVLLREAFAELAANAFDAMPRGGTLTFLSRWDAGAGHVVLELSDDGSGFEPGPDFGRPFYTTKPGRFGLGAAIARRAVAAQNGKIEWISRYGRGTRVVIRLLPRR